MQLFLTADAHSTARDIPNHVDLSEGRKLAFIDTAAEPEKDSDDIQWLEDDRKALVDAGFNVSDYTITGKNQVEISKFLSEFDYIYCSGGDTAHLLNQSYLTGFIDVVKDLILNQKKTYIGTSAGSIITGPRLPAYFQREDLGDINEKPAFGFVNFTVIPHWGSESFKKLYLEERLENVYREDQVPLILLTNTQYIYVNGDFIKIIDLEWAGKFCQQVKDDPVDTLRYYFKALWPGMVGEFGKRYEDAFPFPLTLTNEKKKFSFEMKILKE